MKVRRAVITAAARNQRAIPLQMMFDRDGRQKPVINIIVEETLSAGVEDIGIVVCPEDEAAYKEAAGEHAGRLSFFHQCEPLGYGHAVYCAREFTGDEPFLHLISDHVYVSSGDAGCARQLVEVAEGRSCSVSGVQATRENLLPYFGAVGGRRVPGTKDLYQIEQVVEKPTPTEAEQTLAVPGLRAGHYLCFFGMHVLSPTVMEILGRHVEAGKGERPVLLSPVLDELARREQYLALEAKGRRYPVDVRYGLLYAQLAMALSGRDREEVLAGVCELLAQRELAGAGEGRK
ncbi:MAG: UTP--glucose-1-phosphate uridylyltransferase [Acidobacteria bacterium]|nr:UTP--glucose-1-phosphate uridylyltransferase [Acidobacteriota bacterium]